MHPDHATPSNAAAGDALRALRLAMLLLTLGAVVLSMSACRRGQDGDSSTAVATPSAASATVGEDDGSTPPRTQTAAPTSEPTVAPPEPGTFTRTLAHGGRERTYIVHVPAVDSGPLPVVIVFHGGGGNAQHAIRISGFDAAADRHGFLAVFPNGTGRLDDKLLTWNSGNCCGYALRRNIDDIGFVRTLIAGLREDFPVDPERIYATGMSNGAMLSYRLACEMSDVFAAVGPVAGALNVSCDPENPISLVAVHGTADQNVLYDGGEPKTRLDRQPRTDASVEESVGFFVGHNGCADSAETVSGSVTITTWDPCADGTAVALYTVEGGGHAWPGGRRGSAIADEPPPAPDTTEVMWQFFAAHPRQP